MGLHRDRTDGIAAEPAGGSPRTASDGESGVMALVRAVLDPIEQGIVLIDDERRTVFANRRARQILVAGSEEEVGEIIVGNCPRGVFAQSKETKKAATYIDITIPGGQRRSLLGLELFHHEPAGSSPFYLVLLHDFSDWKRLDDLRSRFATSLSHCMRTPLTAIRNVHRILVEEKAAIPEPERERLLGIGWRNIEKLIGQLDELQKVFMIESEEMDVCRGLIRVRQILNTILGGLERAGTIKGFRIKMPDVTAFSARGRLGEFVASAASAFGVWRCETPVIECVSSIHEEYRSAGGIDRKLKLTLKPFFSSQRHEGGEELRDFLSYREAHRGLVLERLATVLDGELEIGAHGAISVILPFRPPFDRAKDLVHPLHMMMERAELDHGEFHLVSLRMVGAVDEEDRFMRLLESSLCSCVSDDCFVSRGEEPGTYSIFVVHRSRDEVDRIVRAVQDRFGRSCRQSGEELYPLFRWEIRCSRKPEAGESCRELTLVEELA